VVSVEIQLSCYFGMFSFLNKHSFDGVESYPLVYVCPLLSFNKLADFHELGADVMPLEATTCSFFLNLSSVITISDVWGNSSATLMYGL
jgi:hypothetical protein